MEGDVFRIIVPLNDAYSFDFGLKPIKPNWIFSDEIRMGGKYTKLVSQET